MNVDVSMCRYIEILNIDGVDTSDVRGKRRRSFDVLT